MHKFPAGGDIRPREMSFFEQKICFTSVLRWSVNLIFMWFWVPNLRYVFSFACEFASILLLGKSLMRDKNGHFHQRALSFTSQVRCLVHSVAPVTLIRFSPVCSHLQTYCSMLSIILGGFHFLWSFHQQVITSHQQERVASFLWKF